jgi:hypothetical protein
MKKETSNLEPNEALNIACVSGSATTSGVVTNEITTSVTTKKSGWFSDNWRTYYVDEDGKKHYR